MKTKLTLLLLALCSVCFLQAQQNAIDTLKVFYTKYMMENSKINPDSNTVQLIKKTYCTQRLINELQKNDEPDYDLFLNAQDCEVSSLNTLSVSPDKKDPAIFIVSYKFYADTVIVKLKVVFQNNKYLIDGIIN